MRKRTMRLSVLVFILAGLLLIGSFSTAQTTNLKTNTADEELVTFILDDFEKAGSWIAEMPRDQGVIFAMKRAGAPPLVKRVAKMVTDISNENARYLKKKADMGQQPKENPLIGFPYNSNNKFVLGVRVQFMKRGYNWFTLRPPLPIKVPGIAKSVSVYVVGRGYNHWLWLMIRDYKGNRRFLSSMRPLTHRGWRKILFPIKPNIVQEDFKFTDPKKIGITFDGFLVQCDPLEAHGTYYIYFDMLTAQVNLYFEFHKDGDDMRDFW